MQSAEDFMRAFLHERQILLRKALEIHAPFRRKYYTESCNRGQKNIAKLKESLTEVEELLTISVSDKAATAITSRTDGTTFVRERYRLLLSNEGWLIEAVQIECPICRGAGGNSACSVCKGEG